MAIDDKATGPLPTGTGTRVFTHVIEDIAKRVRQGTIKYGEPLTTNNGRNAKQDAYEECLDLCMYLKQELLEESERKEAATIPEWLIDTRMSSNEGFMGEIFANKHGIEFLGTLLSMALVDQVGMTPSVKYFLEDIGTFFSAHISRQDNNTLEGVIRTLHHIHVKNVK